MRFFAFFLFLAVLLLLPAQPAEAPAEGTRTRAFRNTGLRASDQGGMLALPSSLLLIEDSAFEGTAFSAAVLPDTVRAVGDRAFARMPNLRVLNIPDSLTQLGRDAFSGSEAVTLLGSPGGMAQGYAQANAVRFQALEEALPASRESLSQRADCGPALFLLLAFLILCQPRLNSGSAAPYKPLRWKKRAELHPLNLCFP